MNVPGHNDNPLPQYNRGLYLPHLDLWLDARLPQKFSVISHAHGDHIARHETILATPETARLAQHRRGAMRVIPLPYGQPWESPEGGYSITLLPAGHVLGSSQILITERDGRRTLYTGDFKLRPPLFGEPAPIVPCDVLIMEATFGRPGYRLPPDDLGVARLHELCRQALASGMTPVVFAYTLGKAQAALRHLLDGGFDVSVHGAIASICGIYEALGEPFHGNWSRYDREALAGKVLLAPPQTRRSRMISNIERRQTIYLSGWAMDPNAKWRLGVDEVVPLSDHADWPDLLRYVEGAAPERIYTVHGFPELAEHLSRRGYDALHLETHQRALF